MLKEKENDLLSSIKSTDLLDLIVEIENYDLEYRKTLELDNNITFGIEIEYERMIRQLVTIYINNNFQDWHSKEDESLRFGGEITSPIMRDEEHRWVELKKICNYLKKRKVITSFNAGGHIHIGSQILEDDYNIWRKFLKIYAVYEDILFRFLYGEKVAGRKNLRQYAMPTSYLILKNIEKINKAKSIPALRNEIPIENRYQSLNLTNVKFNTEVNTLIVKNTIEFRSPNSTIEEVIWQNNINTLVKLLKASTSSNFDEEFIDFKINNNEVPCPQKKYTYDEVKLKKALEFADLIFENNLDKVYFLKQYLKDFNTIEDKPLKQKKLVIKKYNLHN